MSDLISRADAIEAVQQYLIDCQVEDGDYHADGIERELKALPSAVQGGDAEMGKNQSIMQQSRHDDGRMTREEAIRWMIVERSYIREVEGNDGGRLLIEAYDMAIEALSAEAVSRYEYDRLYAEADYFAKRLRSAVEVVRCKDCRYRNGKVNRKGFEVCDATGMDITDGDFCSFGERREP